MEISYNSSFSSIHWFFPLHISLPNQTKKFFLAFPCYAISTQDNVSLSSQEPPFDTKHEICNGGRGLGVGEGKDRYHKKKKKAVNIFWREEKHTTMKEGRSIKLFCLLGPIGEKVLTSTLMMAVAPQAEVAICVTCLAEACNSVQIMTFFTRGQLSSPPPSPSLACKP